MPKISGSTKIQLWLDQVLLDELLVVDEPPFLTSSIRDLGDEVAITWEASDPDYPVIMIRYSPNDGETWQMLATNVKEPTTSFTIRKEKLPASHSGLIEVVAVNSTQLATGNLRIGPIVNKPPRVMILGDLERTYRSGQPIVLQGKAVDLDGETFGEESFNWWSPDGSLLGRGSLLFLPNGLPLGTYNVVLSVNNLRGAQNEAVAILRVTESSYLPLIQR